MFVTYLFQGIIVGGFVSHYLLERSRLCGQNASERNYHIFYQLIAGTNDQMANKLKLNKLENFNVGNFELFWLFDFSFLYN